MTGTKITILAMCCGLFAASPSWAQDPQTLDAEISGLIRDLDSDAFRTRRVAHRRLVQIGEPALEALQRARRSGSAEVRLRAATIIHQMRGSGIVLYLPLQHLPEEQLARNGLRSAPNQRGVAREAVLFPGTGTLCVGDRPALDTDDCFTLAAWIKPSRAKYVAVPDAIYQDGEPIYPWGEAAARWHGHFILSKWDSGGRNGDYILAVTPSGQLGFSVSNSASRFAWDSLRTERVLRMGHWSHVAATFNRGHMKLYIDGRLEAEKRSTKITHTNRKEYRNDDLWIGALWSNHYNFLGVIDEVLVYNRAITTGEIQRVLHTTRN